MCGSCHDVLKTHSMISHAHISCVLGIKRPSVACSSNAFCNRTSVDEPVSESGIVSIVDMPFYADF